jgi:hypothetical protein
MASQASLPFLKLQGFSICSEGQFVAIPALSRGSSDSHVQLISADAVSNKNVDAFEQELLLVHKKYGCVSLWCITRENAYPFVFQPRRLKGVFPGAQLIYCRDVKDFVRFAQPIGLFLALRGRFFVVVNSSGPIAGLVGKYFPGVLPLYFKGQRPRIGDLTYTQFTMHSRPRRKFTRGWLQY